MTAVLFTDPNIHKSGAFETNGVHVTAPVLTSDEIEQVISDVQQNARNYYTDNYSILQTLEKAFYLWSQPDYPLRNAALPVLSNLTHFSLENLACFGLSALGSLRLESLRDVRRWLCELIETEAYQDFTKWGRGYLKGYGIANPVQHERPKRILQIMAGNVVGPTWISACMGAMVQGPQIIKLPQRDIASFMYFLQTLEELDPGFRSTIACGYFPGNDGVMDRILKEFDLVVAMGADSTMQEIRGQLARVNPQARFLSHGLKISFQVISKEYATQEVAELAAWGIVAFDSNGCFSPANVFVEEGGKLDPGQFARVLAEAMQDLSQFIPPKRNLGTAERIMKYRIGQIQRKLLGENVEILKSKNTDYTVVVDRDDLRLSPTCQERAVIVKPIDDLGNVVRYVEHLSGNLQTVGLAVPTNALLEFSDQLGQAGATNFKIVGTEYLIDLVEPHDGVFDTLELFTSDGLRWTSIGFSDTDAAIESALKMKADCLAEVQETRFSLLTV
jgi:Acyl-CoA reductase (LuxC)